MQTPVNLYLPIGIAIGILLIAAFLYWSWSKVISQSSTEIKDLALGLNGKDVTGGDIFTTAIGSTSNTRIIDLLQESQRNLITIRGDFGPKQYCLKPYSDIWTARNILAGKINLSLYETMPNILIGVGLMFTFIFLALALNDAGQAMTGNQESRDAALKGLIATAGGKFITSIAGLLSSLVWNWAAKLTLEKLEASIDDLQTQLRTIVPDNAPQAVIQAQLGMFHEMLQQNREQVNQLKRFETDFALSISKAIGNALEPLFNDLSVKLIDAFDNLTERISRINEEALKNIMEKFLEAIKGDSAKEMEQFRKTLVEVTEKLNTAGIGAGVSLAQAGDSFGSAINALEKTVTKTNETMLGLESGLQRAKEFTREGATKLEFVLGGLIGSVNGIDKVIVNVDSFVQKIQSSTESLGLIARSLDGTVASQEVISKEFGVGIPAMSSALKDAVNEIKLGTDASRAALSSLRTEFESTKSSIDQTVNHLTSGVSDYSNKVVQLHFKLDEKLAQAITSIHTTITTLEQTMDDFVESLPKT